MGQPRCRMPVTASNFAILLRSGKNTAHRYAVALAELGIKAVVPQTENLLDTPEVASLYFRLSERQKKFSSLSLYFRPGSHENQSEGSGELSSFPEDLPDGKKF